MSRAPVDKNVTDQLVGYIFKGTRCWCRPTAEALEFEGLHSDDTFVAQWEDVEGVVRDNPHDMGAAFEALHWLAELEEEES